MDDLHGGLDRRFKIDNFKEMCEFYAAHELRILYTDIDNNEMVFSEPEWAGGTLKLIKSGELDIPIKDRVPEEVWYIEVYSSKDPSKRLEWYIGIDGWGHPLSLGNHDGEKWVLSPHPMS
jgi:hypothetical protein